MPLQEPKRTFLAKLCTLHTSAAHRFTVVTDLMQDPWAHFSCGNHVCQGA